MLARKSVGKYPLVGIDGNVFVLMKCVCMIAQHVDIHDPSPGSAKD